MSSHCTNSSKAIININFKDGNFERVVSQNPPVNVSLNTGFDIPEGHKRIYLEGTIFANMQCEEVPNYSTAIGIVPISSNFTIQFVVPSNGGSCDGQTSRHVRVPGLWENLVAEWRPSTVYLREEYNSDTCRIQIADSNGTLYDKSVNDNCPTYTVACDDQCPVGQERIQTIEYPGYKCREKCPPETCCECDCEDVICCYGSNGQVLKTISK